jgi:hypothetical protein
MKAAMARMIIAAFLFAAVIAHYSTGRMAVFRPTGRESRCRSVAANLFQWAK